MEETTGRPATEEGFVVEDIVEQGQAQEQAQPQRSRRRTVVRVVVPATVAAVVAAGIGLVPALASDAPPILPSVTAEQLVAKVLAAHTDTFSGTVRVQADLGLPPALLGLAGGGGLPGGLTNGFGGGLDGAEGGGAGSGGSGLAPQSKALELLGGEHTVKIAADGPDRQRVELLGGSSRYQLVHNGDQLWAYDSKRAEALHLTAPLGAGPDGKSGRAGQELPTPQELAKQVLTDSASTTSVTVDGTEEVAGRAAYRLSVKPAQQGSTIAEVRIAVDSELGVPLAVLVRNTDGDRVLDVRFSSVSFAKPEAKTFDFAPPKGAKVTEQRAGEGAHEGVGRQGLPGLKQESAKGHGTAPEPNVVGEGWTAVASLGAPGGVGGGGGKDAAGFGKLLGKPVGGGTLISTKVVNVLVTDDGRVFAGAVKLPLLQQAAGVK